jgi:hypothetical protein
MFSTFQYGDVVIVNYPQMLNALLDDSLVLVVEEFCQVPGPFNVLSIQHHVLGLISREDMVHGHDEAPHLDGDSLARLNLLSSR